jgi:GH18 family chitinase
VSNGNDNFKCRLYYQGNQWVGYDDPSTAVVKANYIIANNLGGAMFWDLPTDDFRQGPTFFQ